jgi:hypothetical protein
MSQMASPAIRIVPASTKMSTISTDYLLSGDNDVSLMSLWREMEVPGLLGSL